MKNVFSRIVKKIIPFVIGGVFIYSGVSFGATKYLSKPNAGEGSCLSVVDFYDTATTTSHVQVVNVADHETVSIAFHVPLNGVVIGTSTWGLEESMDNVTYGSITATEMVRTTNTILTASRDTGTTTVLNAGEFRGTHTQSFVGALGTSTARTDQFYIVKPVGTYLRVQCALTSTGTDSVKYKVLMRSGQAMNKF